MGLVPVRFIGMLCTVNPCAASFIRIGDASNNSGAATCTSSPCACNSQIKAYRNPTRDSAKLEIIKKVMLISPTILPVVVTMPETLKCTTEYVLHFLFHSNARPT